MRRTTKLLGPLLLTATLGFTSVACSSSSGSASSFCDTLKKSESSIKDADLDNKDAAKKAVEAMKQLEKNAPSEIKGDMQTIRTAMEALAKVDSSDPSSAAKAMEGIDMEKMQKAGDNLQKYAKDKCGIDMS